VTKPRVLAKYVAVDVSSTRLNRIWAGVAVRLPVELRWRWWSNAGAATLVMLCVVLVTWRLSVRPHPDFVAQDAVVEATSDASKLELVDGSHLELAARSRIEWATRDAHSTVVKLTRGSVVCDVVPRQGRQFSVFAADVRVYVTGTRFSVTFDPESGHVDVAVQRGSVGIATTNGTDPDRHLGAGEHWSADRNVASSDVALTAAAPLASAAPLGVDVAALPVPVAPIPAPPPSGSGNSATTSVQEVPSPHTLMDQGNAARRAGDARSAANAYQTLLGKFPRDPRAALAAFELGRLRMGPLKDVQGAVRAFQSAIALSPGSAIREDSMAHLVEAFAMSGQSGQCAAAREAYLKAYPSGVHVGLVRRQCPGM
jgi:transmembrane sensor